MSKASVYGERRKKFFDKVGEGLVVIAGYEAMQQTADMSAPFRQQSAFYWLTGITEPGWGFLHAEKTYLVRPEKSEIDRIFNGDTTDEAASEISDIGTVITWKEAKALLKTAAQHTEAVKTLGEDPHGQHYEFILNPSANNLRQWLGELFADIQDCWPQLKALIAIKDETGLKALNSAVGISVAAFQALYSELAEMRYEYTIEAKINFEFRNRGASGTAYDTIVAAEKNACTLHYIQNNQPLPKNGLVLIDAGALVDGYAADITRTYAIGTPTPRQVAVHRAVEEAHHKIIQLIKPGLGLKEYQEQVDEIMKDALESLQLLKSRDDHATYRTHFPHAISHGLGLDVHESLGGYKTLQPGMVLTVEPGIYIPEEAIGVRIEDDILVTETGYRNLSASLPTGL